MRLAVPDAVERVVNMLAVLGVPAAVRQTPRRPDVWWERNPEAAGPPSSPSH
jgi:hypothetical protein